MNEIVAIVTICILGIIIAILVKAKEHYQYRLEGACKQLAMTEEQVMKLANQVLDADASLNSVYRERNRLVALLSAMFPASIEEAELQEGEKYNPEWANVVIIDLPTGQASWYIPLIDLAILRFSHLPDRRGRRKWDGHTTEEKHERIEDLTYEYACGLQTPPCEYKPAFEAILNQEWKGMIYYLNERTIGNANELIHIGTRSRILNEDEAIEWRRKIATVCPGHSIPGEDKTCRYCTVAQALTGRTSVE